MIWEAGATGAAGTLELLVLEAASATAVGTLLAVAVVGSGLEAFSVLRDDELHGQAISSAHPFLHVLQCLHLHLGAALPREGIL